LLARAGAGPGAFVIAAFPGRAGDH
jgi:hypothetical protein